MKNNIYIVISSVALLIFLLFLPMFAKADALPEISQATLEVIEGGMQDMIEAGASYKGMSPYTDGIIASYEILSEIIFQVANMGQGSTALHTCTADDCYIRPLDPEEIEDFESNVNMHIYNRLGQIVDYDDVYKINYDNGYLSGSALVDSSGDILYYNSENFIENRQAVNIFFGGNLCDWEDWNNFYDLMADNIADNNGSFNFDSSVDLSSKSVWYLSLGGTYHGQPDWATSVLVQNCNLQGVSIVVPSGNDLSSATVFYNDGADIYIEYLLDQVPPTISNGDYYYNGFHYSHRMDFGGAYTRNETINDFYRWRYESYDVYNRLFGIGEGNFLQLGDLTYMPKKPYAFKLLQPPNGSEFPALDEGESVDIDDLPEIITEPSSNPIPNPNYDPSKKIGPDNYPLYNPSTTPIIIAPSSLPLPNPVGVLDPVVIYDPDPIPVSITPSGDTFLQIPFLENIFTRYPFCIPWDIKNFVASFSRTPQAPAWNFDYTISCFGYNYTTHFEGDLSDFDDLARIFRSLLLIAFIIGLCIFSYDHHF